MGRLYLRFDRIREFEHRYVIALFLRSHSEVVFVRHIKDYYFEATINFLNKPERVVVNLFSIRELSDIQKESYGVINYSQVTYRISRKKFSGDDVHDRKCNAQFAKEYQEYSSNPLQHILNTVSEFDTRYEEFLKDTRFVNDDTDENPMLDLFKECYDDFLRDEEEELLFKYKQLPDKKLNSTDYSKQTTYLQNFINGEVAFIIPTWFNDPFDSDCEIPVLVIKELYDKYYKTLKDKYGKKPVYDDLLDRYANLLIEYLEEGFSEPHEKAIRKLFTETFDREYPDEFANQYLSIKDKFRILCMTPHYDNILMWGYYGDSGKGVCGGFNKLDIYSGVKSGRRDFILVYGKVNYVSGKNKLKYHGLDFLSYIIKCVFTKAGCWAHEDERRFLLIEKEFENEVITAKANCERYYLGVSADEIRWKTEYGSSSRMHKLKKHMTEYCLIE